MDRGVVILYSVQIVPTTFIVFENFFILLILFSSSEYNYTISENFGNFWDFDFLPILYRKNFVLSTRKRENFKHLLYTIQGPLTIYKILFFLLILLKKCRRGSMKKGPSLVWEMALLKTCAQQESNLYLQLRRLTLYPLSYGRVNCLVFPAFAEILVQLIFYYLIIVTFFLICFKHLFLPYPPWTPSNYFYPGPRYI